MISRSLRALRTAAAAAAVFAAAAAGADDPPRARAAPPQASPPPPVAAKAPGPARAEPRPARWSGPDRPRVTTGVLVRAAKRAQQRDAEACGPCAAPGVESIEIDWHAASAAP